METAGIGGEEACDIEDDIGARACRTHPDGLELARLEGHGDAVGPVWPGHDVDGGGRGTGGHGWTESHIADAAGIGDGQVARDRCRAGRHKGTGPADRLDAGHGKGPDDLVGELTPETDVGVPEPVGRVSRTRPGARG